MAQRLSLSSSMPTTSNRCWIPYMHLTSKFVVNFLSTSSKIYTLSLKSYRSQDYEWTIILIGWYKFIFHFIGFLLWGLKLMHMNSLQVGTPVSHHMSSCDSYLASTEFFKMRMQLQTTVARLG